MTELVGKTNTVSTHSRPKAAGHIGGAMVFDLVFQHTAARRRLVPQIKMDIPTVIRFNTQPPEGGWNADTTSSA